MFASGWFYYNKVIETNTNRIICIYLLPNLYRCKACDYLQAELNKNTAGRDWPKIWE